MKTTLGHQIGTYTVIRQLGAGGMGEVFLGKHRVLGRMAAVKVLLDSVSQVPEIVERFIAEARAAALLEHPGIVKVLDCDVLPDGRAFLVMEYLRGESLKDTIDRDKQLRDNPRFTAGVIAQSALALAEAHAHQIVHRDLKPDNIYLSLAKQDAPHITAKILDFGIAKLQPNLSGAKTQTGALLGTPQYMSPEQCRGDKTIDHRADIYSLGCVLFEMLSGRVPFNPESVGMLLIAHATEPAPKLASVAPNAPPELAKLVDGMLAKELTARPQSMNEVVQALCEYLGCAPDDLGALLKTPPDFPRGVSAEELAEQTPPPVNTAEGQAPTALSGAHAEKPVTATAAPGPTGSATDVRQQTTLGQSATQMPAADTTYRLANRGPNKGIIAGIAGGVVLAVVAAVGLLGGEAESDRPEPMPVSKPAPPPKPVEVSIRLDSDPPGAEIWLDGEESARGVTPLEITVPRGEAETTGVLKLAGHVDRPFDFQPMANVRLTLNLTAKPKKAAKSVKKKPRKSKKKKAPPKKPSKPANDDDPYQLLGD